MITTLKTAKNRNALIGCICLLSTIASVLIIQAAQLSAQILREMDQFLGPCLT